LLHLRSLSPSFSWRNRKAVAKILSQNRGDGQLDRVIMHGQVDRSMLPATLQFIIAMIAYSINERLQRKLDYVQVEVQVLKEALRASKILPDREAWDHLVLVLPTGREEVRQLERKNRPTTKKQGHPQAGGRDGAGELGLCEAGGNVELGGCRARYALKRGGPRQRG
jgi:hypothetical protein